LASGALAQQAAPEARTSGVLEQQTVGERALFPLRLGALASPDWRQPAKTAVA